MSPDTPYEMAWKEEERKWKEMKKWGRKTKTKMPRRTHLMDFASGWTAAIKATSKTIEQFLR